MKPFVRIVNPGTIKIGNRNREVFVKIEYRENGELSLCGVVGPWHSGNCAGSCGQIVDHLSEIKPGHFHKLWQPCKLKTLQSLWRKWHLNHMNPGCEHQEFWDTGKELAMPDGEKKRAGWVKPEEHPEGLLCKPCPVCGYEYGSAWLKREVPEEVLDYLQRLPETDKKPAWV